MDKIKQMQQIAYDLGEPRREIILNFIADHIQIRQRNNELMVEREQIRRTANDLASSVQEFDRIREKLGRMTRAANVFLQSGTVASRYDFESAVIQMTEELQK